MENKENNIQDIMNLSLDANNMICIKLLILSNEGNPTLISYKNKFNKTLYEEVINKVSTLDYNSVDLNAVYKELGMDVYKLLFLDGEESKLDAIDSILFERTNPLIVFIHDMLGNLPIELLKKDKKMLIESKAVTRNIELERLSFGGDALDYESSLENYLSILLIVDPLGDSKTGYEEGLDILEGLQNLNDKVEIDFLSKPLEKTEFINLLELYDIIHFIGHGDIKGNVSGLRINDDVVLQGNDINALLNPPKLLFLNACMTGAISERDSSLTLKLLGLGVNNIIGTVWKIPDVSFAKFTLNFYKSYLLEKDVVSSFIKAQELSKEEEDIKPYMFHIYNVSRRR